MTHPGVYVVTIGIAIGAALLTYFMSNRQQYEPAHRPPTNRTFDSYDEGHRCTICLESIISFEKRVLRCGHTFHQSCIRKWFETKVSCPNCRS